MKATQNAAAIDFVHTDSDTLAGQYLRRYWQPIHASSSLAPGRAIPLRILGQDFTLYRGESGRAHLLAAGCLHRGTQLSAGWVEGDSIRCYFHGWRYQESGQCDEQPAEPQPFCHKLKLASYPTEEYLGFVFAYLGEGPPPPLPGWPEFEPGAKVTIESTVESFPCNYFQHAENIVDEAHIGYVHRGSPINKDPPRIEAKEAEWGVLALVHHQASTLRTYFMMPNCCYVGYISPPFATRSYKMFEDAPAEVVKNIFWYVPIDDYSHLHFQVIAWPASWTSVQMTPEPFSPIHEEAAAVLAGSKRLSDLQDHPELVRIEDAVALRGQGVIANRSEERLGASDAAVILLRKLFLRELRLLAENKALTNFVRPSEAEIQADTEQMAAAGWHEK